MLNFKITNIKLSLKTSFICLDSVKLNFDQTNIKVKKYPNFLVIKDTFTYVFFKSSDGKINHLNITNIPNFATIDISVHHFLNTLLKKFEISEIFRRVDNITGSINLKEKIDLIHLIDHFKNICRVSYNAEKFPGAFLKFNKGTIIVFHTGKCILIGCKHINTLKCLTDHIQKYVDTKTKF